MRSRVPLTRSIRSRITAGAFIVVALVLGLGAVLTVRILADTLTESLAITIEQDLETIGEQIDDGPNAARVIDGIDDDMLVRLSGPTPAINDDDAVVLPVIGEHRTERLVIDGEAYLVASETTDDGAITVARSLEHADDTVSTATVLLAIAVPVVLALIAAVVWVVTGRALAPVERLRRQVDAIGASELERRVDAGDDELGALAATMNRMLARIDQAQRRQRRFVSDASHELRSPLATIRQHSELAVAHPEATSSRELGQIVLAEGARMQDLVEGMLLLARLDERQQPAMSPVDLDDVVLQEAERLGRLGVRVDGSAIGAGRVLGSGALLSRAVRNLADNAARHAEERVAIRLRTEGSVVRLEIEDDGEGIPPAERERVFERFARLDEGRARDEGGSGLGLAIVREIAVAHGGQVLSGEGAGGGALFTMTLPAHPGA